MTQKAHKQTRSLHLQHLHSSAEMAEILQFWLQKESSLFEDEQQVRHGCLVCFLVDEQCIKHGCLVISLLMRYVCVHQNQLIHVGMNFPEYISCNC